MHFRGIWFLEFLIHLYRLGQEQKLLCLMCRRTNTKNSATELHNFRWFFTNKINNHATTTMINFWENNRSTLSEESRTRTIGHWLISIYSRPRGVCCTTRKGKYPNWALFIDSIDCFRWRRSADMVHYDCNYAATSTWVSDIIIWPLIDAAALLSDVRGCPGFYYRWWWW